MTKVDQFMALLATAGFDLRAEILARCIEVGECLEWQGPFGTGRNAATPILRKRYDGHSDNLPVLRILWQTEHGPIPAGKIVYRHCGNDRCVCHIKLGKRGDAHRRRKQLGLMKHSPATLAALTRGARSRENVKCSEERASEIRAMLAEGMTDQEIMDSTGLSRYVVADVRLGRTWKPAVPVASVFGWRPPA